MYDLLKFIDSPDIREYNKETQFTPAEWAVLVSRSMKRSVEEKIEALEYLAEYYSAEEFGEESILPIYGDPDPVSFRNVVIETVHAWKEALKARFEIEGVVFETYFCEQELSQQGEKCQYFSGYEKAWAYLIKEKQEYLDDEDLRSIKTFARIKRIKLDHTEGSGGETYNFDNEMRMISIYIDNDKFLREERGLPWRMIICFMYHSLLRKGILSKLIFRIQKSIMVFFHATGKNQKTQDGSVCGSLLRCI